MRESNRKGAKKNLEEMRRGRLSEESAYTIVRTQQNAYEADLEGDQLITLNSMLSH